jgi:hypothetical protein
MDWSYKYILGIQYDIKKIKQDNHVKTEAYTYRLDWFSKDLPALVQVFAQANFIDLNCEIANYTIYKKTQWMNQSILFFFFSKYLIGKHEKLGQ